MISLLVGLGKMNGRPVLAGIRTAKPAIKRRGTAVATGTRVKNQGRQFELRADRASLAEAGSRRIVPAVREARGTNLIVL